MRKLWQVFLCTLVLFNIMVSLVQAEPGDLVYVVPISGTIDPGLASFVERAYDEAEKSKADYVLLEIDTYGGRIDAAIRIKNRILSSPVPSAGFVKHKAISAGALITLAGEKIFMAPGTTIGAAEPRVGNEKADEKVVSMWTKELVSTAEAHGRDGQVAAAMADADIEITGLVEKGKLLTLSQQQALKWGIADDVAANREDVLAKLDLNDAKIITSGPTGAESVSRWVTNPYVAPILLAVGIAGTVLEIFTVGWGVAGTVGLLSFALYFGGHMIAGLTGWEAVLLFLIGIILFLVEAFLIPGFGFAGIGGIIAMTASIIMASPSIEQAAISLIVAIIGSAVLLAVSFKFVKTRKVWSRLVLGVKQGKGLGYVAPESKMEELLGKQGVTVTPLRPAGTAEIEGERIDVVTEGGFITREAQVKVVKVEGTRIVVREIKDSIN